MHSHPSSHTKCATERKELLPEQKGGERLRTQFPSCTVWASLPCGRQRQWDPFPHQGLNLIQEDKDSVVRETGP